MAHSFKPGDMAEIREGVVPKTIVGMPCIVETLPYTHTVFRYDGSPYEISCVDITVGHPNITKANVLCLKYIPPEEWPKSEFKQRELVRVEGAQHGPHTKDRREVTTTECNRRLTTSPR